MALGLAVGLPVCLALSRLLSASVFGIQAFDWIAYLTVAGGMLLVTALACAIPAHRASRVDPIHLLRID